MSAVTLSSCYKSEFSNTPNPEKNTLKLTVAWDLHEGEETPSSHTLYIGADKRSVDGTTYTVFAEPAEKQTIFIHNSPTGMAVVDKVATLGEATRSVPTDPEPLSGSLYYGREVVNLPQDHISTVTIESIKGSAQILFKLEYPSSEVANVRSVKVELSGVAATRNLVSGELSNEVVLTQYPKLQASTGSINVLYNVLGTVGAKQEFTITVTDINGDEKSVKSDITEQLKQFNAKLIPLTFGNSLDLPHDVEQGDFTINDWTVGEGINAEILNPTNY